MANVTLQLFRAGDNPLLDTPVATVTSDENGAYRFVDLAAGDYFLYIPTPPLGYPVSSTLTDLSDNGEDQDDNGEQANYGGPVRSPIFALTPGGESITDGDDANSEQTIDFGFLALASVGDLVWYDANHDGIQGANELSMPNVAKTVGVPGIGVKLYAAGDHQLLATSVTDSQGHYRFERLLPGNYYLHFDLPAAYQMTVQHADTTLLGANWPPSDETGNAFDSDVSPDTLETAVFVLTSGERRSTVDMGVYFPDNTVPVTVGDWVWYDANGNGIQDGNESGVAGATLALYRTDGTLLVTTKSDSDGHYLFTGLPAGDYYLQVTPPTGYTITQPRQGEATNDSDADPTSGQTPSITLGTRSTDLTQDLGLTTTLSPAHLNGLAWLDRDLDGIRDTDEGVMIGVSVALYTADGVLVATTLTGPDGEYTFYNLIPGDYYLVFAPPPGYSSTPMHQGDDDTVDSDAQVNPDGITAQTPLITLQPGINISSRDYGLQLTPGTTRATPARIGDQVWLDRNANGLWDEGEKGLADVVVKLYNAAGELIGVTVTNGNGNYVFDNLAPGLYYVEFVIPDGYRFSPLSAFPDRDGDSDAAPATGRTVAITVASGSQVNDRDAGMMLQPTNLGEGNEPSELRLKLFLPICMTP